jgi:hypothetical protein
MIAMPVIREIIIPMFPLIALPVIKSSTTPPQTRIILLQTYQPIAPNATQPCQIGSRLILSSTM